MTIIIINIAVVIVWSLYVCVFILVLKKLKKTFVAGKTELGVFFVSDATSFRMSCANTHSKNTYV